MHRSAIGVGHHLARSVKLLAFTVVALLGALYMAAPAEAAPYYGLLTNTRTGLCADLPYNGLGTLNGVVTQYTCTRGDSDNQMWGFNRDSQGYYQIENDRDDLCMDVPGNGAVAPGTRITEYYCILGDSDNQMFRTVGKAPYGGYWLQHVKTGLCLDVVSGATLPGNDAPLALWHCSEPPNDDHVWTLN